jgi:hypothetical protein
MVTILISYIAHDACFFANDEQRLTLLGIRALTVKASARTSTKMFMVLSFKKTPKTGRNGVLWLY